MGNSCASGRVKSTCPEDALTDAECRALIHAVGSESTESLQARGFESLSVGFANDVAACERGGKGFVIKHFKDLVYVRLKRQTIGVPDVHAGNCSVGPRVLYADQTGLVMERIDGNTLQEIDMHKGDYRLIEKVARSLAALHQLAIPDVCAGTPMLWRTTDQMFDLVIREPGLLPEGLPGIITVTEEINRAKAALESCHPKVVFGHGDFKPSNVIVDIEGATKLIDFELAGPNYRGFDLMKVFRTGGATSTACMEHFVRTYLQCTGSEEAVATVMDELKIFEPLTWLEAAVFFFVLPKYKPDGVARWNELAVDRWGKYMQTRGLLM